MSPIILLIVVVVAAVVQAETKTYERHRHPGYHILFLVRT